MEAFVVVLVVLIGVFLIIAITGADPKPHRIPVADSSARLTLEEVVWINRISALRILAPEMAIDLAARLQGDAWQVANASLCATLLELNREDKALALYSYLDAHHSREALAKMLYQLIDAGEAAKALELLKRTGDKRPSDPLLRIPLLLAEGDQDTANSELETFATTSNLSAQQWLGLARLQRQSGKEDAARHSLAQFWALQKTVPAEDIVGLEILARELAFLGDLQQLLEISDSLSLQRNNPFIAPMIEAGWLAQAQQQIQRLDANWRDEHYDQLLDAMLRHRQLREAEALLEEVEEGAHDALLLRLAQWWIDQGAVSEAERDVQRLSRHETQRISLYLSLWSLYEQSQPDLVTSMLGQAERWIEYLPEDTDRDHLRLQVLNARLTLQSRLPERQRTSYEIRRALEQIQRLAERQPLFDRAFTDTRHALLLQRLDRPADARSLLDNVRGTLVTDNAPEEIEAFDMALLLDDLAIAYLRLGDVDKAVDLIRRIPGEISYPSDWIDALLEQDLLAHAVDGLGYRDLFDPRNGPQRLLKKLDAAATDESRTLKHRLLDKVFSDDFWRQPNAV